jgi:hypothetical protein
VELDIKVEDPFDILPQLDTGLERDLSNEYSGDSCSFTPSIFSDQSTTASYGHRRPSLASSTQSASPEAFWTPSTVATSPMTPTLVEPSAHQAYRNFVRPATYLTRNDAMLHHLPEDVQSYHNSLWDNGDSLSLIDAESKISLGDGIHTVSCLDVQGFQDHDYGDSSLGKSIFTSPRSYTLAVDDDILGWHATNMEIPAETVEPGVAFRATIPSSPCYKVQPSTPLKRQLTSSVMSNSSPSSVVSADIVPSQYEMDDDIPIEPCQQGLIKKRKTRASDGRRSHRGSSDSDQKCPEYRWMPKRNRTRPKVPQGSVGMNCDPIIPTNKVPCTHPGCNKMFKRSEHQKRHQRTVHESHMHPTYPCWVCGTRFNRTDNLRSHLTNTHSKRPGVRGNCYAATLDKNSEFYDPEWVGKLDKNGYPILS